MKMQFFFSCPAPFYKFSHILNDSDKFVQIAVLKNDGVRWYVEF